MRTKTMKKFNCDNCNYSTNYRYNLRRHSMAKHPDKVKRFKCNKCNYSNNNNHHLRSHSKAKHQKELNLIRNTKAKQILSKHTKAKHHHILGEKKTGERSRENICLCSLLFLHNLLKNKSDN